MIENNTYIALLDITALMGRHDSEGTGTCNIILMIFHSQNLQGGRRKQALQCWEQRPVLLSSHLSHKLSKIFTSVGHVPGPGNNPYFPL